MVCKHELKLFQRKTCKKLSIRLLGHLLDARFPVVWQNRSVRNLCKCVGFNRFLLVSTVFCRFQPVYVSFNRFMSVWTGLCQFQPVYVGFKWFCQFQPAWSVSNGFVGNFCQFPAKKGDKHLYWGTRLLLSKTKLCKVPTSVKLQTCRIKMLRKKFKL
jgi:hypothetical protein